MSPEALEKRRKSAREYMARQRAADPMKVNEKQREWAKNNPAAIKALRDKYYAAVKDTPEYKAKRKLERENFTEAQLERKRKTAREYAARKRAIDQGGINDRQRERYRKSPEIYRAYANEWRNSHRDAVLERRRELYQAAPEKYRAWSRSWYEKNTEKARLQWAKFYGKNRSLLLEKQAEWRKTDAYTVVLAKRYMAKVVGIRYRDVTPEMGDAKAAQLKVKRAINALD